MYGCLQERARRLGARLQYGADGPPTPVLHDDRRVAIRTGTDPALVARCLDQLESIAGLGVLDEA